MTTAWPIVTSAWWTIHMVRVCQNYVAIVYETISLCVNKAGEGCYANSRHQLGSKKSSVVREQTPWFKLRLRRKKLPLWSTYSCQKISCIGNVLPQVLTPVLLYKDWELSTLGTRRTERVYVTNRRKRIPLKPEMPLKTTSQLCRMKRKDLLHQERYWSWVRQPKLLPV